MELRGVSGSVQGGFGQGTGDGRGANGQGLPRCFGFIFTSHYLALPRIAVRCIAFALPRIINNVISCLRVAHRNIIITILLLSCSSLSLSPPPEKHSNFTRIAQEISVIVTLPLPRRIVHRTSYIVHHTSYIVHHRTGQVHFTHRTCFPHVICNLCMVMYLYSMLRSILHPPIKCNRTGTQTGVRRIT